MSITKNIKGVFAIQVANTLFSFLSLLLITRILGPEGRGAFSMYNNSLGLLVTWLGISLPSAITFFIAKNEIDSQRIFSFTLIFHVIMGLITYGVLSIFDRGFRYLMPSDLQENYFLIILVLHFTLLGITQSLVAIAAGRNRFKTAAVATLLMNIILCALWIFLMNSRGYYPLSFIVGNLFACSIIPLSIMLYDIWKHGDLLPIKMIRGKEILAMIRYTWIAFACNALQFLTYRLDIWILNDYHGQEITGQYSTAVMAAQLLWLLPNTIGALTLPKFAADQESKQLFTRGHQSIVWLCMISAIIIYIAYYIFYPYVIGSEFKPSLKVLPILLLAAWLLSPTILTSSFHAGNNVLKYNLYATIVGLVINILFNILLIPKYNMIGAALATLISYLSIQIVFIFLLQKRFQIHFKDLFKLDINNLKRLLRF